MILSALREIIKESFWISGQKEENAGGEDGFHARELI
jgi:hypothetical protein